MAGGPILPCFALPVTAGKVFENVSNSEFGFMGVMASVDGDAIWRLNFLMPPSSLPSGTGKIHLLGRAAATTGVAKINVKWKSVAAEEDPSDVTDAPLNAEGTSTVTWSSGDSNVLKELKVNLDADTLVAGELVVMDLTFETTSWTLAQVSTWLGAIIWE
jgi:hypothetical protein